MNSSSFELVGISNLVDLPLNHWDYLSFFSLYLHPKLISTANLPSDVLAQSNNFLGLFTFSLPLGTVLFSVLLPTISICAGLFLSVHYWRFFVVSCKIIDLVRH